MNLFQTAQHPKSDGARPPFLFPFVVPASRLRHYNDPANIGKGQPSQPNAIVLVTRAHLDGPPKFCDYAGRFAEAFEPFGAVRL